MQALRDRIAIAARAKCTVMITGETGTGKELVAKAIHYEGSRSKQAFVAINCGAIPESMAEAELFGHVRGAFTGAHVSRVGRIEQADKGTLFLDEIGTMPATLQCKLLRAIEDKEVMRIGGEKAVQVDARIIAATNGDLEGSDFRRDLFYRLNVFKIETPALRDHLEDIPEIVQSFSPEKIIDPLAITALKSYDWPGNVRELRNCIEQASVVAEDSDTIGIEHLQLLARVITEADVPVPNFMEIFKLAKVEGMHNVLDELNASLIRQALVETNGNKSKASNLLKLKRTTLIENMKRLAIS